MYKLVAGKCVTANDCGGDLLHLQSATCIQNFSTYKKQSSNILPRMPFTCL